MYIPLTYGGASQRCLYARGGLENVYVSGSQQWGYHIFTSSGNFTVDRGTINEAEVWVVGGGGGGSATSNAINGGGGGGGVAYQSNVRLFGGTYSVTVGAGGSGGYWNGTNSTNGQTGGSSSFNGANYFLGAGGGGGGQFGTGFSERGGSSGDPTRFLGGLNASPNGGGGGGATQAGYAGNATPPPPARVSDGGMGASYYITPDQDAIFGCGGGGDTLSGNGGQGGCYSAGGKRTDANPLWIYGGGGGGGTGGSIRFAGSGGSGCVIIKYPIAESCNDFFNETGSCDCRQVRFEVGSSNEFFHDDPEVLGYYIYTPCGTNTWTTGSLYADFPNIVCAASASWYWVTKIDQTDPGTFTIGKADAGPECSSGTACVTQSFSASCVSTLLTFYIGTGSASPQEIYYVPKTGSQVVYESIPSNYTAIRCVTTTEVAVLAGTPLTYPYAVGGAGSQIYSSSCTTTDLTASWNGVGVSFASATLRYWECNGTEQTRTVQRGATSGVTTRYITGSCVDPNRPVIVTFSQTPTPTLSLNYGASCLNNYVATGSCGCP